MHAIILHKNFYSKLQRTVLLAGLCLVAVCMLLFYAFQKNTGSALPKSAILATSDSTIVFHAPLKITKGGTYSGNWESRDSEVPAIEIKTSEPVIIENSIIRSAGPLIRSLGQQADITIRNTKGYGLEPTPWRDYKKPRRFLALDVFKNVVVENCYMENTAGIYLGGQYTGNSTPSNTVKIRYNKARNIDGRIHDGLEIAQFVQFNFRGTLKHAEIAWNEVINEPNNSAVEDNINIFNSRGAPGSPIRIHNNFIKGAFPLPADKLNYTGGGILVDAPGTDTTVVTAHIKIHDNQLVGLGNHCIGIAGGNNIEICNNRAVVAATFSDGAPYGFWTSGIWAKDYYKGRSFFKNKIHHNTLAITGQTGTWRNDISDSTIIITEAFENTRLPGRITREMEAQEFILWQQKLELANIKIGPQQNNTF